MPSGSAEVARSPIPTRAEREAPTEIEITGEVPLVGGLPASGGADRASHFGGVDENGSAEVPAEATVSKDNTILAVPTDIITSINDATLLLMYLAGNGDKPSPDTISAILSAKQAIETRLWTIDVGKNFLEAYAEVSK